MSKLISAFAKDNWAITGDAVHTYFPLVQSILNGNHQPTAEDLPEDDFESDEEATTKPDEFTGRIAVMSITGVLMHYGGMCSYGAVDYANRIDAYRMDESISGLIIRGDGPGGQVQGTKTLREAIANFKAVKPLLVLVDDGCIASALVWAFTAASEIYCSNNISQVGSVGVMACFMDVRKAMEMEGYKEIVIYAPQSTDKNKDMTDALDGKLDAVKAKLKFLCDDFIADVAAGRAGKLTSDEWNTGKMFFAEDATRIGLIDGIKNYPAVVARMQELIALNQNSNNMALIGSNKLPKMAALKGKADITAEDLDPVNEEITAFDINGVTVCLDTELQALQASHDELPTLKATVSAHETLIANLQQENTALKAKVAGKPAAEPIAPSAEADVIDGTEKLNAYETSVDREMKAKRDNW